MFLVLDQKKKKKILRLVPSLFHIWEVCDNLRQLCRSNLRISECTSEFWKQSYRDLHAVPLPTFITKLSGAFCTIGWTGWGPVWSHTLCATGDGAVLTVSEGWWMTPPSAELHSSAPLAFLMKPESAEWDLHLCTALYHAAVNEIQSCSLLGYCFFLLTVENTVYNVNEMEIFLFVQFSYDPIFVLKHRVNVH